MAKRRTKKAGKERRDIFLSHRSINKDIVRRLAADLEAQPFQGRPLTVWVDEAEIRPGQSITGLVNEGLEISRFIGLVMTPEYFASESGWTDAEWHAALFTDPDNRRARVLPLLAADCPYIPVLLRHLRAIDFRDKRYADGLAELLAVLRDEPLPRPVAYRGQLIQPGGRIDRATLIAERAVPDADPDACPEKLYCNLLPIERLPQYVYAAPISAALRENKQGGDQALPSKAKLKDAIRADQERTGVERPRVPAFRVVGENIVTFHDLESPDSLFGGVVDSSAVQVVRVEEYLTNEDQRHVILSLLNMAISRHLMGRGLVADETKRNRFFFPPQEGNPRVIDWTPLKKKTKRTVAKPYTRDGQTVAWLHHAAYIKAVFLASKPYIQITPTRVLTEDGQKVKGGPEVGRIVVKWIGQERNLHVLYHVRFWTSIMRRGPGPISVRVGDQWMEVGLVPAFIQQAYGIRGDQMDLMDLLDQEAPLIAQKEEEGEEIAALPEDTEEIDSAFDEDDAPGEADAGEAEE